MAASCVTAEHCKSWEKSGKQEFLKFCKGVGDKTVLASLGNRDFRQAIFDVCHHVVKEHLKPDQAVQVFTELKNVYPDFVSLVSDILGLLDVELSCTDDSKVARDKYTALVQAVAMFCSILSSDISLETSFQDISSNMSHDRDGQEWNEIFQTVEFTYKQQKFNLLREESEGYSKLVTELNQVITEKVTPEITLQNIKSLIGCFNLDPNRVIEILLESFENHPDQEDYYVPLIKSYVQDNVTLCHVLGFKFQFFKDDETPTSLYKLAALLMKNELVDLDTLYPHLYPPDNNVFEYAKKEMADAKLYARKLQVVSLSDKANEDKKKEEENDKFDPHTNNQKMGLVEALLSIGAWDKSKSILDRLPEFFGTTYKPVATALCALIHTVMDPAYRKYSGLTSRILSHRNKNEMPGCTAKRATTYTEVNSLVFPMVSYLGPYASCDPILLVKLIRIGKTYMHKRNQGTLSVEDNCLYFGLLSVLDEVVIPSLAFLTCNCCVSEELWVLLKMFPYELRYRMYGNWKNEVYMSHPKLIRVRADAMEKAKYIMKRLSKENVKPSGRQLGKLSHSNPGVLFEYVIRQVEKYDNLIGPVVDSLKYLTNLSYDILVFCIIEAVANPEKEKMKFDETSLALWLQSLANFAGSICKKYQVELAGFMQYVTNQLKAGKSIDLLLMREIVQKMAGIEISEEITTDQLEAMSGGELLKQEGGYFTQVRNTKKSSNRLKDTVLEHDLALSLCLLISQQRDAVIYKEGTTQHIKLLGKLYDQCQDTLVQFGSFLSMQLSTEEFVKRLPPIDKMVGEYHVPPDAAFFLSRPLFSHEVAVKFDELRKADKADKEKKSSSANKLQNYLEAAEIVMSPVVECVRPLHNPKIWEDLSPTFYVTFWSLSMYDIHVPSSAYEKQMSQLTAQINGIEDNKEFNQSKRKKEKDRCNQLIEKLRDEEKRQTEHTHRVLARLKNEKESWFVSRSTKNETITQFLQLCIFPRCCFTASDAVYCAEFIHILHNLKTPNFSTLICYDRIFCDITYTVSSCTENEAHRYGRFLCAALQTVMRWHSNKAYYDKECGTYPGFVTVFRKGENSNNKADQLDFENYRHVCHKWHFRITKAMVACIESGNYIQIRNALIVLTKILPHYPRILQFGSPLERRVDRLRQEEKEKRPDLYALAMGYSGQLKSKKGSWVNEIEFHQRDKEKKAAAAAAAAAAAGGSAQGGSGENGKGDKTKLVNGDKSGTSTKEKVKVKTEKTAEKTKSDDKSKTVTASDMKRIAAELERRDSPTNTKRSGSKEKKDRERKSQESDKPKCSDDREDKPRKESSKKEEKVKIKIEKEDLVEKRSKSKEEKAKDKKIEKLVRVKEESPDRYEEKTKASREKAEKAVKVEVKVEKKDKESRKEDRIKLKRSYSPEHDDVEAQWEERGASVASNSSSGHRSRHHSPEESPRLSVERDSKRRKTDVGASSSKEDTNRSAKSHHHRSLSPEKDRDREKREKKRAKKEARAATSLSDTAQVEYEEHSDSDLGTSTAKKRRGSDLASGSRSSSKLNGDSAKDDRHHDDGHVRASSSRKDTRDSDLEEDRSRGKDREKKKDRSSSKRTKKS